MEDKGFEYQYETKEMSLAHNVFGRFTYPFAVSSKIFPDFHAKSLHRHDYLQFWYSLSGEYIHYVGKNEYHCKSGSLVIVPPGVGHTFETSVARQALIVSIDVPVFFFTGAPEPLRTKTIANLFLQSFSDELHTSPRYFVQFEGEEKERLEGILTYLLKFDYAKPLPNILTIRKRFCEIFNLPSFTLSEKQLKTAEKLIATKLIPIMDAVLYMNKNFGEKIESEDLCSVSAMCYSDFFKYFKKILGITFTEYLRILRIEKAKSFICFSRYSLDYIADICGLCDRTYLSSLFKKYYGCTIREERARQANTKQNFPFLTATHDSLDKLNLEFDR